MGRFIYEHDTQIAVMTNGAYTHIKVYTSTNPRSFIIDEENEDHRKLFNLMLELQRGNEIRTRHFFKYGDDSKYYAMRPPLLKLVNRIKYRAKKIFGFYVGADDCTPDIWLIFVENGGNKSLHAEFSNTIKEGKMLNYLV